MLTFRTILHPTDFSEQSAHAFRVACSLARDHKAKLLVLHVAPPPLTHGEVVARRAPDGYDEQLRDELRRLEPQVPGVDIERRLDHGDPVTVILDVAQEVPCDLIVMGTHGRTGVGRLLMGSVAEKVLRKAQCPVMTVKGPVADTETESENVATGAACR